MALVEFALILPVLMLILLGMLDFGRAFNYWIDQTHIANEGSRWAVVNANPGGGGQQLQKYLQCSANTGELKNGGTSSVLQPMTVAVSFPPDPADGTIGQVGDPVRVSSSTSFSLIPFVSKGVFPPLALSASSTMRLEQMPTNYFAGIGTGASRTGPGGPLCP